MEDESAKTTSGSNGLRLTGFSVGHDLSEVRCGPLTRASQVYDAAKDSFVSTPKQYGKAIPSSELANGVRRFFPCSSENDAVHQAHELTPSPPKGLPPKVLLEHLRAIQAKAEQVASLTKGYEWRIYGGSLLIVYEGSEAAQTKSTVKLIDFAHARYLPGEGPYAGFSKGLDSVLRLLSGRIAEVQALS